jgi:hypothetical protein
MRKYFIFLILAAFAAMVPEASAETASGIASNLPRAEGGYRLIDTDSLKKLLDMNAPLTVVDSRNTEEYQEVHVKGGSTSRKNSSPPISTGSRRTKRP